MKKLVLAAVLAALTVSGSGCVLVPIDDMPRGGHHDGHHSTGGGSHGGDRGPGRGGPDRRDRD